MSRELEQKLWFEKVGTLEQLGQLGLANLRDEPGVRRLISLNAALCSGAEEPAPWPVPDRDSMLSEAIGPRGREPGSQGRPWLGFAIAAVVVLLAALGVVQALRLARDGGLQLPGGEALRRAVAPAGVAWAEVDGYVLEYQLAFDDYFSGTALDPPDHPVWLMNNAVEQWAEDNGVAFLTDGEGPRVQFELNRYQRGYELDDRAYSAIVRIKLPGVDEDARDQLLQRIADLPGVPDPQVFSETMYFSEKYPETYYPGRKLVINGITYVYPQDFAEDEADSLRWFLMVMPSEQGHSYIAFMKIGDGQRIPLADVIKVRYGETIYVEDYLEHYDRDRLKLASFEQTESVFIPASETGLDFDPIELMERTSNQYGYSYYGTHNLMNRRGFRYVVNLLPEQTWRANTAGQPLAVSDSQREAAQQRADALDAEVAEWVRQYPEIAEGGDLTHLLERGVVSMSGEQVQWQATLWLSQSEPNRRLQAALREAGADELRVWQMRPSQEQIEQAQSEISMQGESKASWTVRYQFIDPMTPHGMDVLGVLGKMSDERKAETVRLAEDLEGRFKKWLEHYREENGELEADIYPTKQNDAILDVTLILHTEDESIADAAITAVTSPGLPDPEKNFSSGNGRPVNGITLRARLFDYERFIGIGPEQAESVVPADELERAEDLATRFEKACREWVDMRGADAQVTLKYFMAARFGDVPVTLEAATEQQPSAAVDDLQLYLEQQIGIEFEQDIPRGYNAGGDVHSDEAPDSGGSREFKHELLAYNIMPERAYQLAPQNNFSCMLTEEDSSKLSELVESVSIALDRWNEENPPPAGNKGPVAILNLVSLNNVPQVVSINSTRIDEETLLSIAAALENTGLPDYRYGIAYSNRHARHMIAPPEPIKGNHWQYMLVPSVRWMGRDMTTIGDEFTEEEKSKTLERTEKIKDAVVRWIDRHPDLGEHQWLSEYMLEGDTVEFNAFDMDGIVLSANVGIWMNDDERRNELVDDLVKFIEEQTGEQLAGRVMGGTRRFAPTHN